MVLAARKAASACTLHAACRRTIGPTCEILRGLIGLHQSLHRPFEKGTYCCGIAGYVDGADLPGGVSIPAESPHMLHRTSSTATLAGELLITMAGLEMRSSISVLVQEGTFSVSCTDMSCRSHEARKKVVAIILHYFKESQRH
jgi:hypothetical protein